MKDSSEIIESAKIFDQLISQSAVVLPADKIKPKSLQRDPRNILTFRRSLNRPGAAAPLRQEAPPGYPGIEPGAADSVYRGDRLENVLFALCKRGGFVGAVLIDHSGLPLAIYNSPVEEEVSAAFTMIMGEALEKAGKLLKQTDSNNISVDINYTDKAVIRRFSLSDMPYFIMIICPQEIDARAEVELSIEQVLSILKKN